MNVAVTETRLQIESILYPTDLSLAAETALPTAVQFAERYGARVYAVHVTAPDIFPFEPTTAWTEFANDDKQFCENYRKHLEQRLENVKHETIFREGQVWPVLSAILCEKQIDMIVLSTHGRSGIDRVLAGSGAEEIFRKAPCPVLTVGPRCTTKAPRTADPHSILFATDFSEKSLAAAPFAISLAHERRAQLILLHCSKSADVASKRRDREHFIGGPAVFDDADWLTA